MSTETILEFGNLKQDIANSGITSLEEDVTFEVETNTSEYVIAATLSRYSRSVIFLSRTLPKSEWHHSSVEKENVYAIVEVLKKW